MAVTISGKVTNNISTEATHPSGAIVKTTAPKDNGGDGSLFSPTDTMANALGACMSTIAGIWAQKFDLDITGMTYTVEKHMNAEPRRVARLPIHFVVPAAAVPEERRKAMESAMMKCPVKQSLHPDVKVEASFSYE